MIFFLAFILITNVLLNSSVALDSAIYVVHMDGKKMKALDESLGSERSWHEEIIESITISDQDDQTRPQIHYVYNTLMSGFSAKMSEQHLASLERVDGFVSATRDKVHTLHTTHSAQFLGLHIGEGLWSANNLAVDVIIGVVDTGIYPEHISFNGLGHPPVPSRWKGECQVGTQFKASDCNRKLIGAAAFFKGYESNHGRINESRDYRSSRDFNGHGTHTASIAGGNRVGGANMFGLANGTATGMRYTARIATYKACYELGCYGSDILAAMEQAVKDGVDVLSLSMGGIETGSSFYDDPLAIGAFGAMKKGVIVSASAGNEGPATSTVVNSAPWLMTVAASTTDRNFQAQAFLGDGRNLSGASLFSGNPTKMLPLVYSGTTLDTHFCRVGSLSPSLVKGKIVICVWEAVQLGNASSDQVVKEAGGAGMILVNHEEYSFEYTVAKAYVLPALWLGESEGDAIIDYARSSKNPTAMIKSQGDVFGVRAPAVAPFSSRGPSSADPNVIKPDVTAPGVNILAAWIGSNKMFNLMSGSSMSCSHVSGLMALLKSLHMDWSPAAIKSVMMTTAYVYDSRKLPIVDESDFTLETATPFDFDSGHVDLERASDPGLVYDISNQDYLNYLCSMGYDQRQMAHFTDNFTCRAASHFQSGDLNYPSFKVINDDSDTDIVVTTHRRTVTNVGIGVSTYSVKVVEPEGVSITVHPKLLVFSKIGEKRSYDVTFKVKRTGDGEISFGSLEWVSAGKKRYSVRSPVAITI